jgi:hypothetical protein
MAQVTITTTDRQAPLYRINSFRSS